MNRQTKRAKNRAATGLIFRLSLALLLLLLLSSASTLLAQSTVTELDELTVDLWPDYDRRQVLVLLTGFLPTDAPLPATVTIPIPPGVELNAVARIGEGGAMFSDVEYDDSVPGMLTFTTPDPSFRIEYYMPYVADGNDRSFTFSWQSDTAIDSFLTSVQQPSLANEISLSPKAEEVTSGGDGLTYHEVTPMSLAPGEAFELAVSYTLIQDQLTAEILSPQEVPLVGSESGESTIGGNASEFNWLVVAGAAALIILVGAGGFFVLKSQRTGSSRRRVTKPRPTRSSAPSAKPTTSSSTRFCHECGQPVDATDSFCSNCGAAQKQS